jgi:predicted transcriptional regulator
MTETMRRRILQQLSLHPEGPYALEVLAALGPGADQTSMRLELRMMDDEGLIGYGDDNRLRISAAGLEALSQA